MYVTNDRSTSTLRIAELTAEYELVERARAGAERALRASVHAALFARRPQRRVQRVDGGRLSRHSRGRRRDRAIPRADARPRHRPTADVLARRQAHLLRVRPQRRLEHLRLRPRVSAPRAGHERHQRRVLSRAVGRTSARWSTPATPAAAGTCSCSTTSRPNWLEPLPTKTRAKASPARPWRATRSTVQRATYAAPAPVLREVRPGAFGNQVTISTSGGDIAGLHGIAAALSIPTDTTRRRARALARLCVRPVSPTSSQLSGFRSSTPRNDYSYSERRPPIVEHLTGVATGVSLAAPR